MCKCKFNFVAKQAVVMNFNLHTVGDVEESIFSYLTLFQRKYGEGGLRWLWKHTNRHYLLGQISFIHHERVCALAIILLFSHNYLLRSVRAQYKKNLNSDRERPSETYKHLLQQRQMITHKRRLK